MENLTKLQTGLLIYIASITTLIAALLMFYISSNNNDIPTYNFKTEIVCLENAVPEIKKDVLEFSGSGMRLSR
mgnify:CR=1 FL=1